MTQPPPEVLANLTVMADLRATGLAWEAIAVKIARSERVCRRWRERYRDDWLYLLREAQRAFIGEVGHDAMIILRRISRDSDHPKQEDAAKFLAGAHADVLAYTEKRPILARLRQQRHSPLLDYMEKLNDDELQKLSEELNARRPASETPARDALENPESPPVGQ